MQQQLGSGKTAVLVERIIHKIIEERIDIDKLLVVTFTNAAASEMRQRVLDAIYKKQDKEPENKNLQRQIILLAKSNICTIHSFCLEVIKNHFYEIGISPNFKIGEETELTLLKQETIEELFEKKYEEQNQDFIKLINTYTTYRDDEKLKEIILNIYGFIQSNPFPEKWLNEKVEIFNIADETDFAKTIWGKDLYAKVKSEIKFAINRLKAIKKELDKFLELEKFSKIINQDYIQLEEIVNQTSWDKTYEKMCNLKFDRWPQDKKVTIDLKNEAKDKRDKIKKDIDKIKNDIMVSNSKQEIEDLTEMYKILQIISNLVKEFSAEYSKRKNERNMIDFNDIEHYALNILINLDDDGNIIPTNVAKKYQQKFEEIAIDEYQDSNQVQEYILSSISRKNNMFMVGDVKQSIYKFRQACPDLFLNKYENYKLKSDLKTGDNLKIQLFKNFRSRKNILDFTNLVFKEIMSKDLGDIEYNEEEYLNLGADYPENIDNLKTQIEVIDLNKEENEDEDTDENVEEIIEKTELEARFVANKIKDIINSKKQIYDKKSGYRPVTYKDIVILLRSTSSQAKIYEQELNNLGFPVFSDINIGYLDSEEIKVIMSMLKVIDNPMQDIPLCTVLRSVIGGFNDNDLIEIRIKNKNMSFYESIKKYIEDKENENKELRDRISRFVEIINEFQIKKEYMTLDELIWNIYDETNYYYYVSLMPNGKLKTENLKMLFEKAKQYESTSFKGLFNFIQFIEKLKNSNGDLASVKLIGENDNVIRIMSIHKSKGLEFPVVFLCGTGKQFNMKDLNEPILLHQNLGFGPEYISTEKMIQYNTLAKQAIKEKIREETLSEEMRILYVALTRAKEKLIITGVQNDALKSIKDKQDILDAIQEDNDNKINSNIIKKQKSYLDWLELVYICNKDKEKDIFEFNISNKQKVLTEYGEITEENQIKNVFEKIEKITKNSSKAEEISNQLNWKYKYKIALEIPSKSSVSKVKQIMNNNEEGFEEKVIMQEPKFVLENIEEITPARKGTLIHMCMQRLDIEKEYNSIEDIKILINKMVKEEVITQVESKAININVLFNFTKSRTFKELKTAQKVYREKPFYIMMPVKEIYKDKKDFENEILVQGIIDLYYIDKEGNQIIVDYKTDYVENKNEELLIEKYKTQLQIYKKALEQSSKKEVKRTYIYSTYLNKEIEIFSREI